MMTKMVSLPLNQIFVDYAWNSRSQHDVMSSQSDGVMNVDEGLKEGNGLAGLCTSILANGQDSPVTVREIHDRKLLSGNLVSVGYPAKYELICGFRRYTALGFLYDQKKKVPSLESGHIWAMIRELTPIDARLLNIRENTDRSNLSPADLTWGVLQLKAQGLTGQNIAEQLNISMGYVSRLWKVASLPLPILEHWRGAKVKLDGVPLAANGEPIPTRVLTQTKLYEIADTVADGDEKIKMYVDAILGRKTRESVTMAIDLAEERVKDAARFAGELVASGVLVAGDLQWSKVVGPRQFGFLIPTGALGNNPGPRLQKLWQLAQETYEKTINEKKKF
jgi:transcriptional regulator with XRE-family HTH domain